MNNLIKNELIKIFKKKSIYITLFVILGFIILTNCIYKYFYNNSTSYYNDNYIDYAKQEISKLDPNNPSDTNTYISLKTEIDVYELAKKYNKNDWQTQIINSNVGTYINERNTYLYGEAKDTKKAEEVNKKIEEIIGKLDNNDWKYFANDEVKKLEENLKALEEQKNNIEDKQELDELNQSIELAKIDLEAARYRVDKDIKYGNDYLNIALDDYLNNSKTLVSYKKDKKLSFKEQKEYNQSLENKEVSKYIIENKQDVNKVNDVRGILKSFFDEYGLFIIVLVVMIAGTIVSEEFNKGTIKLLLVKPYSRNKILFAKFITILIMIVFAFVSIILMELIVGSIVFGTSSLNVPVVQYNFNTHALEQMNIFKYLGLNVLTQLPIVLLLATLAFSFSTLFTNSAVSIALPLLGYMSASTINVLAVHHNIKFIKYFVTPNWDLSQYLFGNLPMLEGMTRNFSIIICLIYFAIMFITTFTVFKRKNIKNI